MNGCHFTSEPLAKFLMGLVCLAHMATTHAEQGRGGGWGSMEDLARSKKLSPLWLGMPIHPLMMLGNVSWSGGTMDLSFSVSFSLTYLIVYFSLCILSTLLHSCKFSVRRVSLLLRS